jgi:myo-inositol-1(or 4)-monophosphatase
MTWTPFVEAAYAAAVEVGVMLRESDDPSDYLPVSRGAGGDPSIGLDLKAEAIFARHLMLLGTILSEESGRIEGEGEDLIILDPIDGSDNLKSRFPYYGASVALQQKGETTAGVICNFATGDCFLKYQDTHLHTSLFDRTLCKPVTRHSHAKVGLFEKSPVHPELSTALMQAGLKFRAPGAIALSLAYAHEVNYVVFIGKMRAYDLDAGLFMCEDLHVFQSEERLVVAKDKAVFDTIVSLFSRGDH